MVSIAKDLRIDAVSCNLMVTNARGRRSKPSRPRIKAKRHRPRRRNIS
jgi:hypothetical protein